MSFELNGILYKSIHVLSGSFVWFL